MGRRLLRRRVTGKAESFKTRSRVIEDRPVPRPSKTKKRLLAKREAARATGDRGLPAPPATPAATPAVTPAAEDKRSGVKRKAARAAGDRGLPGPSATPAATPDATPAATLANTPAAEDKRSGVKRKAPTAAKPGLRKKNRTRNSGASLTSVASTSREDQSSTTVDAETPVARDAQKSSPEDKSAPAQVGGAKRSKKKGRRSVSKKASEDISVEVVDPPATDPPPNVHPLFMLTNAVVLKLPVWATNPLKVLLFLLLKLLCPIFSYTGSVLLLKIPAVSAGTLRQPGPPGHGTRTSVYLSFSLSQSWSPSPQFGQPPQDRLWCFVITMNSLGINVAFMGNPQRFDMFSISVHGLVAAYTISLLLDYAAPLGFFMPFTWGLFYFGLHTWSVNCTP